MLRVSDGTRTRDRHDAWEQFEVKALDTSDLGNGLVFTNGRVEARGRRSGLELDSPLYFVWRLSDERFQRGSAHLDREAALRALRAEGVAEDTIGAMRDKPS
jgi:hypothetical protein